MEIYINSAGCSCWECIEIDKKRGVFFMEGKAWSTDTKGKEYQVPAENVKQILTD